MQTKLIKLTPPIEDMIYEILEETIPWAMGRPFSAQLLGDVIARVQSGLDTLKSRGAILAARAWLDPELNTEATLKVGKLFIDFDIEPVLSVAGN